MDAAKEECLQEGQCYYVKEIVQKFKKGSSRAEALVQDGFKSSKVQEGFLRSSRCSGEQARNKSR